MSRGCLSVAIALGAAVFAGLPAAASPAASLAASSAASLAASAPAPAPASPDSSQATGPAVRDSAKGAGADSASPPATSPGRSFEGRVPSGYSPAARDSGTVDTVALKTRLYEFVAHPILQALTLPVELVLVPAFKAALYPIKPPLNYLLNENVIDRVIGLISFGRKEEVMIYPTINLAPGTGSFTGMTLRHRSIFGRPKESLVTMGNFYVNGDWKFRGYLRASEVLGTPLDAKISLGLNRVKNTSVSQPDSNISYRYADTSNTIQLNLGWPLFWKFQGKVGLAYKDMHFGEAPANTDTLVSEFFRNDQGVLDPSFRGLNKEWSDRIVSVGIGRDTRINTNIPLSGTNFNASWAYHFSDASGYRPRHDYHNWEAEWAGYFKLGKERYEITSAEERKMDKVTLKKVLRSIDMENIRSHLFNRKVLVIQLYAAEAREVEGHSMPVYALTSLGSDTPLRGYGGSRFRDYAVTALSMEYRFPVIRLMDGTIFNEYGAMGKSIDEIDYGNIRNSWGFGIRVRRPDIFLFRAQLGFHGIHGAKIEMSVDEPF